MSAVAAPIPLTEMDHADPPLMEELLEAVRTVASRGAFTGGPAVEAFEQAYAAWCEVPHAVGVSSGTEALALALRALGIGPGEEVVVPANSFVATAEAVSLVGARPRFADVEEQTQLMSAATLERALTDRVRCVIPVHLYGRTVEMDPILELARARGLAVIEDASQAHGARYRRRPVGSLGDAGTFSFYPAKNLGAWGDAGAVVTRHEHLAERVRLLRSHGESPRYHHQMIGTTGRLDAVQAAVLTVKLGRLAEATEARRRAAGHLTRALEGNDAVLPPAPVPAGHDHVYHQFVVRTADRDALRERLTRHGIASAIHYPIPIHRSKAYEHLEERDAAPCATRLAGEIVSLPIFPGLDEERVGRIANALADFASAAR
jgi:dTDP-3-amino-3,4,6-trideoxy-alpha-D-glucose transaminase